MAKTRSPTLPDQPPGVDQGFVVDHVQRHDGGAIGPFPLQRAVALAMFHGDAVHQPDPHVGLPAQMDPHIGLVHRGDGMARHAGVPVQPVAHAIRRHREQVAERLIPRDGGGGDHQRVPLTAQDGRRQFRRPPDRSDMRG